MGKEQKNMLKQMSIMKKEMSSQLSAILDMLSPLRGDSTVQVEDHGTMIKAEKEVPADDQVDAIEFYNLICCIRFYFSLF